MYALFLAVALIAAPPVDTPPTKAVSGTVESSTNLQIRLRQQLFLSSSPAQSTEQAMINQYLPYGEEINELNDWYQRYRAGKRWQNGVGITFAIGWHNHRWVLGLGPVQFTFGEKHVPPVQ